MSYSWGEGEGGRRVILGGGGGLEDFFWEG
jgi:hypothetical protein